MDIIDLPHDLFLLVVAHLSARTAVVCRSVSRRWKAAFLDQDLNLQLLKWHFPRCREMRMAYVAGGGEFPAVVGPQRSDPADGVVQVQNESQEPDWTATFALVASRYHHLRAATPRSVEKIKIGTTSTDRFYGVATWDRYLRLDDKTARFHYPDPSWCYSQDDGLLVYHVHPDHVKDEVRQSIYPWRLLDLATRSEAEVPFPHDDDRIVRRLRLADGVLVFEWCERLAYHQLNDRERCHRHFVSAFGITRVPSGPGDGTWDIAPRAEFKCHFLGLPLNAHDRFLSAHTRSHYAVYVWQPNRSPWGEDDPIESVIVWDIGSPARPARILRKMTWSTLAFYGVRQRSTPRLSRLGMDEASLYFVEEEHRWAQGGHSSLSPPRVHLVRSTGVPVIPGPSIGPVDDDNDGKEQVVQGPRWLDQCGANGDVNLSFCSRVDDRPPLPPGRDISPGIWNGSLPSTRTPTLSQELQAAFRAPPARWPGWAPCWRHEEFPYLTVSEAVDFRAGVRVAARHCFMLETISVHVRPSLTVRGVRGGASPSSGSSSSSSVGGQGHRLTRSGSVDAPFNDRLDAAGEGNENRGGGGTRKKKLGEGEREAYQDVEFADEYWDELLGKGFICGDERWLVGEDREGRVTIVRF